MELGVNIKNITNMLMISKMTEWSHFASKANHLIPEEPKSMLQPLMPKKLKLKTYKPF